MHDLQDRLARQTWSVFHTSGRAKGMGTRLGQTPGIDCLHSFTLYTATCRIFTAFTTEPQISGFVPRDSWWWN